MKTYVDTDGNIIGRQIAAKSEEEETNLFQYLKTKDGEKTGFLFAVDEADGGAVLEGSGTEKAGLLNGSYILSADGEEMLKAELVDQDLNALKEGSLKGTCFLSGVSEENDVMSGMLLTLTSNGTDNKNDLKAALSMGDSYLGAVFLTSEDKDNLTVPEKADIREVYDFSKEEDVAKYTENMDLDGIMDKLTEAGMPEGWLDGEQEMPETYYEDNAGDMTESETDATTDVLQPSNN